jgi:peptidoglycan/xylan/chitin deacetylase (PgdA/CDA1 family)
MRAWLKNGLRTILYRSGLARWLGRHRVRDALTVVMFHRVLPADDPRWASADPTYTMELSVFEDFLDWARQNFQPVSFALVEKAAGGGADLPPHALLVTLDDGWHDTFQYAAPALAAHAVPSLLFITSGALGDDRMLWRDAAAILMRDGALAAEGGAESAMESLGSLPAGQREAVLGEALQRAPHLRPLMMEPGAIRYLAGMGMALGGHGVTHTPLTQAPDPDAEFSGCRTMLVKAAGTPEISSFAFPHGRYSPELLRKGFAAGFRFLFTSDSIVNRLRERKPVSPVFGRIAISQQDVTDTTGRFSPQRALFFLTYRRPMALDAARGAFAA